VFNNGVAILGSLVDGKRKKVLRAQSGNMGWESGTYKVTVKGAVVETGKFLSVSRKKDGKWHYVRDNLECGCAGRSYCAGANGTASRQEIVGARSADLSSAATVSGPS